MRFYTVKTKIHFLRSVNFTPITFFTLHVVSHNKCVSNLKHQGIMLTAQIFVLYTQKHTQLRGSKHKQHRLFCNQSNESCIINSYFKDAIQINKSRLRLRHYLPPYTHAFRYPNGGLKNVKCTPISELSHH
jgi:hypothetical protein